MQIVCVGGVDSLLNVPSVTCFFAFYKANILSVLNSCL